MDKKILSAILVVAVAAVALVFLVPFLPSLPSASGGSLNAEFAPSTIKNGESSILRIRVENQKDEESSPIVKIRTEKSADSDYVILGQKEWQLYPMKYSGEVQLNKVNVSASSPASESKFNVIVSLEEGDETIFTKKVSLVVQRE
ncbi:hypothetical protein AUJ17_04340 [Candidatus Micrarchaeota archaeon CG1_02_47_40]|nr:MAG: hypothetical protein AUJ17_04340 [Candidatus Micrarchaeota archaeon CG1_02_47_40]